MHVLVAEFKQILVQVILNTCNNRYTVSPPHHEC